MDEIRKTPTPASEPRYEYRLISLVRNPHDTLARMLMRDYTAHWLDQTGPLDLAWVR